MYDAIESRTYELDPIDYRPVRVALAITGTAWAGWLLAPVFARLVGGWPVLLAGVAAAILLLGLGWRLERERGVAITAGLTILVGIGCILSWPITVARAAAAVAPDQPYCIMIGDGGTDYRRARTKLDLTPLLMRATEWPRLRNQHAVLILPSGGGLHFSYRRKRFERGHEGAKHIDNPLCTPRPLFAERLPIW